MKELYMRFSVLALSVVFSLTACGGGSSSDGVVFQGTLTQKGEGHSTSDLTQAKHASGQRIDEVKICVLGECSITDGEGQWGVNVNEFSGGDVTVLVEGHGISSSVTTNIPDSPRDIVMDLEHSKNVISIAKLLVDGEDHTGHNHDH
jgi:hypothetical protein